MEQRPFGLTGLSVSTLGFGAGHIGYDDLDDAAAGRLLHAALEAGVTFVDTARGYGLSEERIGTHLAGRRDQVVLSTKVGYDVPGVEDWTPEAVTGGIDRALATLRTDVVDVVFLHSCPLELLERGEVVTALLDARQAGKIRVAGYSGENEALAWAVLSGHFGAVQTSVNLVDQWSVHNVATDAADRGLAVVAKRPLANAPWRHATRPVGEYGEVYWERLQELGLAPAEGRTWLETALRFAAYAPGVATAIVGTGSTEHLTDAVRAAEQGPLPEDEVETWVATFAPHLSEWPGLV